MSEEEKTALDIDFIIIMALAAGTTAAVTTTIALLMRPLALTVAQRLPLPQLPLPPMPGSIPPPTM